MKPLRRSRHRSHRVRGIAAPAGAELARYTIESLERRMLLAGSIQGTVFNDINQNGVREAADAGAAGWQVYLDLNHDASLNDGEPVQVTDAAGSYIFTGLNAGAYSLGLVPEDRWTSGRLDVSLPDGQTLLAADLAIHTSATDVGAEIVGSETRVNTFTNSDQNGPVIAANAAGNTVFVWQSSSQDGNGLGVYAQPFNATGAPLGGEFRVNTTVTGEQSHPAAAMDASGNFIVVFQGATKDGSLLGIFAQRYNAAGAAVGGEFQVNTFTTANQSLPVVAMRPTGEFVIAWASAAEDGSGMGIYAQRYDAAGGRVGQEFRVNSYRSGDQTAPSIALDGSGNFAIVWQTPAADGSGAADIAAQRFDASGSRLGGEMRVNDTRTAAHLAPAIASNAAGDTLIVFTRGTQIVARRYNASGVPQGGEFAASQNLVNQADHPSVAVDAAGNFLVTWQVVGQDGAGLGIYARQGNAAGVLEGDEFRVNTTVAGDQSAPVVVAISGGLVAAWQGPDASGLGVYTQRYQTFQDAAIISGTVWRDQNDNGIHDPSETGIDGVTMTALDSTGKVVQTTTTAGGGNYHFGRLKPGSIYSIQVGAVAGSIVGLEHQGADATLDSDADPTTGKIGPFTPSPRELLSHEDVSIVPITSISGVVYNDVDGGGHRDAGEAGLGGWVVFVDANGDGKLSSGEASAVTDATGAYSITGVRPGNYAVVAAPQNHWSQTTPASALLIVAGGPAIVALDIGQKSTVPLLNAAPVGPEFRAGVPDAVSQNAPSIAENSSGAFVIAWEGSEATGTAPDIYAQPFDATGAALGPRFPVNSVTAGPQVKPVVAIDSAGGFVVAWQSPDASGAGIFARRFDAAGAPLAAEFPVNTTSAADQTVPSVAMLPNGGFVIAWTSNTQDGSGLGIYARRFDANANPITGEFLINTTTAGDQTGVSLAIRPDGAFWAAWRNVPDASIRAQLFDSSGVRAGPEVLVGTNTLVAPMVAVDPLGDCVVAWSNSGSIFARRLGPIGDQVGLAYKVNTLTSTGTPSLAMDAQGNYVIVYTTGVGDGDKLGVLAQRYSASGLAEGSEVQVNTFTTGDQQTPVVAMDAAGNFTAAWTSNGQNAADVGVYAQRYIEYTDSASVGDFVWSDANSNGLADAGEAGVDGVTVILRNAFHSFAASAITAGGGHYRFNGLKPGLAYEIEFRLPPGKVLTLQKVGSDGTIDSDPNQRTRFTPTFILNTDQVDLNEDAGLTNPATISGTAYFDLDQSLSRDSGEVALEGWQVFLDYDLDGNLSAGEPSVFTDVNGNYTFAGLPPGTYRLGEVAQTHWNLVTPPDRLIVTMPGGQARQGVDLAEWTNAPQSSLAANGAEFRADGLPPGSTVSPVLASNANGDTVLLYGTFDSATASSTEYAQRISPSGVLLGNLIKVNTTPNAYLARVAVEADGSFIVAWETRISESAGVPFSVLAQRFNSAGSKVGPEILLESGILNGLPSPAIAVASDGRFAVVWRNFISGNVTNEPVIRAKVFNSDGTPASPAIDIARGGTPAPFSGSQTTGVLDAKSVAFDAAGRLLVGYSYGVIVGSGSPAWGYVRVYDLSLNPVGSPVPLFIDPTKYATAIAIAPLPDGGFAALMQGSVLSLVRADAGYHLQGGPLTVGPAVAFPGASMTADSAGNLQIVWQATTDQKQDIFMRRYNIAGVPLGDAIAVAANPDDQTAAAVSADAAGNVTVAWSDSLTDFIVQIHARRFSTTLASSSIVGRIWNDANGNGLRDTGEAGIDGVSLALYTFDGVLQGSAVTSGGGLYRFPAVSPGSGMYLVATVSSGMVFTIPNIGADDSIDSDFRASGRVDLPPITSGQALSGIDGGLVPPASVSGLIYKDTNLNGVRDAGEPGLEAWIVYADTDNNGQLGPEEAWTTSNAAGAFTIPGLYAGTFPIRAVQQDLWVVGQAVAAVVPVGQSVAQVDVGERNSRQDARFDALGNPVRVNSFATGDQDSPSIAIDGQGRSLVTWLSVGSVLGQRYDASGNPTGNNFNVYSMAGGRFMSDSVAMNASGAAVIVSVDEVQQGWGQRYAPGGAAVGPQFRLETSLTAGVVDTAGISAAMDSAGNFVVTWAAYVNNSRDIYLRRFSAGGSPLGPEVLVNTFRIDEQYQSHIAMDPAGDFVVVWYAQAHPLSRGLIYSIFAQRYNSAGNRIGGEFNVTQGQAASSPAVAMGPDGSFVVAWELNEGLGTPPIRAQRFNSAGIPQGAPLTVSDPPTGGYPVLPTISMDRDGNFLVAWEVDEERAIHAQWYSPMGERQGGNITLQGAPASEYPLATAASSQSGAWAIAWSDVTIENDGNTDPGIAMQRYAMATPPAYNASPGDDVITLRPDLPNARAVAWVNLATSLLPTYSIPTTATPAPLQGLAGNDTLHEDLGSATTLPAGLTFDGGDGWDVVDLTGTIGNDLITLDAGGLSYQSTSLLHLANIEALRFTGGGGDDRLVLNQGSLALANDLGAAGANVALSLNGNAVASFVTPQDLASLTAAGTSRILLDGSGQHPLSVGGLSISDDAAIDLNNNSLIVSYSGPSPEGIIQQYVISGLTSGRGLLSSHATVAGFSRSGRALAVFDNHDAHLSSLAGEPLSPDYNQVLAEYTYLGDANVDGRVDPTDYASVDGNQGKGHNWITGDLNFDGKVDPTDYAQIDGNQGAGYGGIGGPQLDHLAQPPAQPTSAAQPASKPAPDVPAQELQTQPSPLAVSPFSTAPIAQGPDDWDVLGESKTRLL
jgi:protocatechuate 3,4-dioxygenase beta subunit